MKISRLRVRSHDGAGGSSLDSCVIAWACHGASSCCPAIAHSAALYWSPRVLWHSRAPTRHAARRVSGQGARSFFSFFFSFTYDDDDDDGAPLASSLSSSQTAAAPSVLRLFALLSLSLFRTCLRCCRGWPPCLRHAMVVPPTSIRRETEPRKQQGASPVGLRDGDGVWLPVRPRTPWRPSSSTPDDPNPKFLHLLLPLESGDWPPATGQGTAVATDEQRGGGDGSAVLASWGTSLGSGLKEGAMKVSQAVTAAACLVDRALEPLRISRQREGTVPVGIRRRAVLDPSDVLPLFLW